jgi:tetratricopeptide (TPR) repeat protein
MGTIMTFNTAQLQNLTPEQVKDIAEGRLLLMDVLGVSPGEMVHHFQSALNLVSIGKIDDAIRTFKGLAALDSRNPAFPGALASIELMRKNYPAALEQAQRVVALDPKFVAGYYVLGETLAQMRRKDEAIAAFEKAFDLSPNDNSRDAKRCRTIYMGLSGKPAPGPMPSAGTAPVAVAGGAPMPATVARPAPAQFSVPRSMPTPIGRGTAHGGAFSRGAAGPAMISRAGVNRGAPPMRA